MDYQQGYRFHKGQASQAAHNLAHGRAARPEDADDALAAAMYDGWLHRQTTHYRSQVAQKVIPATMELLDKAAAMLGPVECLAAWRAAWERIEPDIAAGHNTTGRELWAAFVGATR